MRLQDKVIVITGSTRGIGKAIAQACAKEGASVVVSSRSRERTAEVTNDLRQKNWKVAGMPADVSLEVDVKALIDFAVKSFGKIDVWVNNAGMSSGYLPVDEIDSKTIKNVIDINLTGTILCCKYIIPYFVKQGKGILLNMSGRGGNGEAAEFTAVYNATKAAVTSLTKSIARENRCYRISINSVIPGMVETDFYRDIKTCPRTEKSVRVLPQILKVFGVPLETVGEFFVKLAMQEPGKVTGKSYSLITPLMMMRSIPMMMWLGMTGKLK